MGMVSYCNFKDDTLEDVNLRGCRSTSCAVTPKTAQCRSDVVWVIDDDASHRIHCT